MSTFNTLSAEATCAKCGARGMFDIQFRYGDTWQYHYQLGQKIRWGGNDVGSPDNVKVLVAGIGGPCPKCGADYLNFSILIENNIIVEVSVWDENSETTDDFKVIN